MTFEPSAGVSDGTLRLGGSETGFHLSQSELSGVVTTGTVSFGGDNTALVVVDSITSVPTAATVSLDGQAR